MRYRRGDQQRRLEQPTAAVRDSALVDRGHLVPQAGSCIQFTLLLLDEMARVFLRFEDAPAGQAASMHPIMIARILNS